jgi:azurin
MQQRLFSLRHPRSVLWVTLFSVFLFATLPASATATECSITLQTDDALRFIPSHIAVPATCKDFTVTLTHTGHLPPLAMSHNWVLTKKMMQNLWSFHQR